MGLQQRRCSSFVFVSRGRYCQERATQVLDDFAAVGTFLLNCEETVLGWLGPCLSLTNGSMYRHSLLLAQVKSSLLNPPQLRSGPRGASASKLHRVKRLIVVPNGLRLGTCQSSDGSVWPSGSGRRIPLTVRSPTSEDQYCEAFAARVRCDVAVRSNAGAYQPFA